jgi:hypothetical protein
LKLTIKKIALASLLVITVIAGLLVTAIPTFAANPSSISLESKSVGNGATFTINLTASSSVAVAGGQATVSFNATMFTCNSATYNTATPYFGSGEYNVTPSIDNGLGKVSFTSTTGGPTTVTGTGVWATLSFTAKAAANNSFQTLSFNTSVSFLANNVPAALPTDLVNGIITVGQPPAADLTVSNVGATIVHTGTSASTDPTTYTVHFQVNNTGNLDAGASTAWVVVDGGAAITVATPAITQGNNSGTLTSATITLTGTYDTIVVTADATNVIPESNETNNTANLMVSFSYPVPGQTTDVNGTFQKTLSFTQPASVDFGANMQLGDNSITQTINVKSNEYWTLQVLGTAPVVSPASATGPDAGKLTKFTTATTTYDPYIKLHNQLHVITANGYTTPFPTASGNITPANNDVPLTGAAQVLATGIPEGQQTDTAANGYARLGETRTLYFSQLLLASDAHLASSGDVYHNQVVFQIASVGF